MKATKFLEFLVVVSCAIILSSCQSKSDVQFKQYYVQGVVLYNTHCSNCHQKDGKGLGLMYPPLNKSDFMENHFVDVICIMKNGKSGNLVVNGKTYNQPMPGIPTLTNLEIAEIATFIYNTWSHERGKVELAEVARALDGCNPSQ